MKQLQSKLLQVKSLGIHKVVFSKSGLSTINYQYIQPKIIYNYPLSER